MNQIFIIFLLIILIIGVLYYYTKKESFNNPASCLDLYFNTTDKSKPLNEIFTEVYSSSQRYDDPKTYTTFMNPDFTESYQEGIASFLGLREAFNLKAKENQHYVVRHMIMVSFTSPIDKYLEIIFNNFDNIPFVKITYNHSEKQKKLFIETKLPDNPSSSSRLIPRTSSSINTVDLPNGLYTQIFFTVVTIRRNGEIRNEFQIYWNDKILSFRGSSSRLRCYSLLPGIEKHFYNALKNITIYASGNTFKISHLCTGTIYGEYDKAKIESIRVPKNSDYFHNRAKIKSIPYNWGGFDLIIPDVSQHPPGYLPLGAYMVRNEYSSNVVKGSETKGALILKEGDYVIPGTKYWNIWDNGRNYGSGWAEYPIWDQTAEGGTKYIFMNSSNETKNVNGVDYTFKGLGGDAITIMKGKPSGYAENKHLQLIKESTNWSTGFFGTAMKKKFFSYKDFGDYPSLSGVAGANFRDKTYEVLQYEPDDYRGFRRYIKDPKPYTPLALVREDCLEDHPAPNASPYWSASGAQSREASAWTYIDNNFKSSESYPGELLMVFSEGQNSNPSPDKKLKIKESCLLPQPQLITNEETNAIIASVKENTDKYLLELKNLKREKDAIVNTNVSQMNEISRFKNNDKCAY